MRIFSFGGGIQSVAVMVLIKQGKIHFDQLVFSNVGHDSENPKTIEYIENIARPYCNENNIPFIELKRYYPKSKKTDTLYNAQMSTGNTFYVPGWLRQENGEIKRGKRACTIEFKIDVVGQYTRAMGATKTKPFTLGLGISIDEYTRMRTSAYNQWEKLEYPLIDLNISREDCIKIIAEEGLPVPDKSSCFFCPYKRIEQWKELKDNDPKRFEIAIEMEEHINNIHNTRPSKIGGEITLWSGGVRLKDINFADQNITDFDENCESGYCLI